MPKSWGRVLCERRCPRTFERDPLEEFPPLNSQRNPLEEFPPWDHRTNGGENRKKSKPHDQISRRSSRTRIMSEKN